MVTFNPNARRVFGDFVVDGIPSSGDKNPQKPEIRTLLTSYENAISAVALAGTFQGAWDASTGSFPSGAQKGYSWIVSTPGTVGGKYFGEGDQIIALINGASTSTYAGNWVAIPAWTSGVVPAIDAGDGTANAIQVTTEKPVDNDTIVVFELAESTTGSPVTVSINGGAALTLKTNRGNDASALTAGMEVWGRPRSSDSTFRLSNDQDVSALVAQAEDAKEAAEAAAEAAENAAAGVEYPVSYAPQSLSDAQQLQAQANIGFGVFKTLADLEAATVPAAIIRVQVAERETGKGGGAFWIRFADEPGVPALAKVQDALGAWWKLEPGEDGRYSPLALGAKAAYWIDPATRAVYDKMAKKPTPLLLRLMDDMVERLKSFGLWDKLSHLNVGGASDNMTDFLIDWKNPAASLAVATGSFVYEANRGPKSDATSGWVNFGYAPNSFGGQNDMHVGVWTEGGTKGSNLIRAIGGAGLGFAVQPAGLDGVTLAGRLNNSSVFVATVARREGYTVLSRSTGTNVDVLKDGKLVASPASVSIAPHANNIVMWNQSSGAPSSYEDDRVLFFHVGTKLTAVETMWLYRIFRDFRDQAQSAALIGSAIAPGQIDAEPFDCHPAIQAAIDLGDVTLPAPRIAGSHYWLGNEIKVPSFRTLKGDGWAAKLKLMATAPSGANCITNADWSNGNEGIKIKGLWIDGNRGRRSVGAGRPGDSCIVLAHVRKFEVEGNYCKSALLHGINVSAASEAYIGDTDWKDGMPGSGPDIASWYGGIHNNYVTDHNDDGITTHYIQHVDITGNKCWQMTGIHSPGSNGIEVDDASRWTTVIGNSIWECHSGFGVVAKGHEGTPATQCVIISNNVIENCNGGISTSHLTSGIATNEGTVITGNNIRDILYRGIWAEQCSGYSITANRLKRVGKDAGTGSGHGCIRVTGAATGGVIANNNIDDTYQQDFAVMIVGTDNIETSITGNTIKNTLGGIRALLPDIAITGNMIRAGVPTGGGTKNSGIALSGSSAYVSVVGNNIRGFPDAISDGTAPASAVIANNVAVDL